MCYTSDLQNITCQWNGSRYGVENEYKPFYKMGLRYFTYILSKLHDCLKSPDLYDNVMPCFSEIPTCF